MQIKTERYLCFTDTLLMIIGVSRSQWPFNDLFIINTSILNERWLFFLVHLQLLILQLGPTDTEICSLFISWTVSFPTILAWTFTCLLLYNELCWKMNVFLASWFIALHSNQLHSLQRTFSKWNMNLESNNIFTVIIERLQFMDRTNLISFTLQCQALRIIF